jgi:hypothetical protein
MVAVTTDGRDGRTIPGDDVSGSPFTASYEEPCVEGQESVQCLLLNDCFAGAFGHSDTVALAAANSEDDRLANLR